MITFYDLATTMVKHYLQILGRLELRYVLNYKRLPYKTVSLEYPDVEPEFKKLGIPPSTIKQDGTPFYTCPSIIDNATKKAVTDSYKITEYLDETYPDSPRVIPKGTEALQAAFYDQFWELMSPIFPITTPLVPDILNPVSAEFYEHKRYAYLGKLFKDLVLQGEERVETWKKVEKAFDTLNGWLSKSTGPFFMGDTITFADLVVAAMFQSFKVILNENSEEWKDIMTWNNGRWKLFMESMEPYASMEN